MVIFIFLYGLFVKCEKAAETYLCVYSHWFQLRPAELETNLPVKFTIPEKALPRAFSCFKVPTTTPVFTYKTLLRYSSKQALEHGRQEIGTLKQKS